MSDLPTFVLLIVLVLFSAFFSASETALVNFNKLKLAHLVKEGDTRALILQRLYDDGDKFISAILVGNNLVNSMISAISTALATEYFASGAVGIAVGSATALILVFGEITPKSFAINNSEQVALFVAPAIRIVVIILTPVVLLFNALSSFMIRLFGIDNGKEKPIITEEELSTLVDVSVEEGILKRDETDMIKNIFSFKGLTVEDAMRQRMEIVAVPEDATYDEVVSVFSENKLSRIPVYNDTIDDIVGILYVKDLFFSTSRHESDLNNFDMSKVMRKPVFVNEFVNISDFFKKMQSDNIHIAIVLDEYGGVSGLITLEDVIESIVGDIFDEYDKTDSRDIVKLKENVYIINAGTKLTDIQEETGIILPSEDYESLGGYILENLGQIPKSGQVLEKGKYNFTVLSMEKNRIVSVKVTVKSDEIQPEETK